MPCIFGRKCMKNIIGKSRIAVFILLAVILVSGCTDKEKNKEKSLSPLIESNQIQNPVSGATAPDIKTGDIAVKVNGNVMTRAELENKVQERMKTIKAKLPAGKEKDFAAKQKDIETNLRKQMEESFIVKTLLGEEFDKRKITVSTEEIKMTLDKIATSIPPSKKLEDYLAENKVTRDDIIFAIKINKFKAMEVGQKARPTSKEISSFYNENRDKLFTQQESVHVRHILVALGKDDNDKVKAQKKEKIENIRKQLLKGGKFSELAKQNSDCPSKEFGGDLNFIKRGQMAKPFENAAFSQKKDAIGPVVKTEFGYHIIQVIDHKPVKRVTLEQAKNKIVPYLEQKKKIEIYNAVIKKLRDNAQIVIY